jgi:hypothetical protein
MEYSKRLSFYKPNKRGTGAAVQFDFNPEKECLFLEAAKQTGEQAFGWDKKLVLKIGVTDAGKILALLYGKAEKADLFHDPTKSKSSDGKIKNTALSMQKGGFGYFLKDAVQLALSDDEAIVLRLMLETAVRRIYGW